MLHLVLAITCLVGAAGAGWFVFAGQKETRWYNFEVLGTAGHGFMLAYMGVVALFHHHAMAGMMVAAALSAVPMLARGFFKLVGLKITAD